VGCWHLPVSDLPSSSHVVSAADLHWSICIIVANAYFVLAFIAVYSSRVVRYSEGVVYKGEMWRDMRHGTG
jgi:hypothetical protein